jgi:hypothetical protein
MFQERLTASLIVLREDLVDTIIERPVQQTQYEVPFAGLRLSL